MKKNNKKQYTSPVLKKFGAVAKMTMKITGSIDSTTSPGKP
jgi:hypothetical protein